MFRLAVAVAASSAVSALASPAFAQDTGFYVGADIGAVVSSETDQAYTPAVGAGTNGGITTDHELGLAGAAFAGYDFGMIRVEAEAGFMSADIDELTSSFGIGTLTAGSQAADGEVSARTAMANVLVDVGGFSDFAFFAGGGAGVAQVKVSEMAPSSGFTVLDDEDSDWRAAWQAIVGLSKPLTSNIDLHVRYRYFTVDDVELTGFGGRVVNVGLDSHSVVAGVTYSF